MQTGSSRRAYELRKVSTDCERESYHAIRERVLWEARGRFGSYDRAHADEQAVGNQPFLLVVDGASVGVIRVDVRPPIAWFRRFSTGTVQIGKRAVQRAYEQNFSRIEDEVYRISNVHWVERADDVAVYLFDFNWSGRIEGRTVNGGGRGTCVLRRRDDVGWRLVIEHLGPGTS